MVRPTGANFVRGVDMARRTGRFTSGSLVLIASVLTVGLSPRPATSQAAEVRIVTLRAAAEENYRAQIGWEATLRRTVKTVSDIYEKNFRSAS
jgi:hypothetical protein